MSEEKHYGMVGWREFATNRRDLLRQFDSAREKAASRPVKTEHGNVGEAALRGWLESFLPAKYAVTSGFIIPDFIQPQDYKLYHYDVIIFDRLNAPVLWVDESGDNSDQGKSRALPARYVRSVFEVKAAFGASSAREALVKLAQLNKLAPHLPSDFSSFLVFFELPDDLVPRGDMLRHLLPSGPIFGLRSGLIFRCSVNPEVSATMFWTPMTDPGSVQGSPTLPLAKDVETLNIYLDGSGNAVIAEGAAGATFTADYVPDGVSCWHPSKMYSPCYSEAGLGVVLCWSFNGFSRFTLDLLAWLEGADPKDAKYRFAQVFDHLERR